MSLRFRTKPYDHQRVVLEGGALRLKNPDRTVQLKPSMDREAFGLFHEPGLGKTKTILDNVTHLVDAKAINGLLVLAPNGVHRNWESDEIPTHLPEDLLAASKTFTWSTNKKGTLAHRGDAEALLRYGGPLAILLMSYNAIMTDEGAAYARRFLDRFRCLYDLDESHRIKTPGAKRTKRVLASAKYARFRRINTGTFVSNSPFDAYTQLRFLNERVWHEIGCPTYLAFKNVFGVWEKRWNGAQQRQFDSLKEYKNLDVLHRFVDANGSRLLKDDVLDLPPKVPSTRYFELNKEQQRVYDELREDFFTIRESGLLTTQLAISRLVRFQQCTSGYLPASDEDDRLLPLGTTNPRLACLLETLEELQDVPTIVWAKYTEDVDLITAALAQEGVPFVRYDGKVSDDEREEAKRRYQKDGTARVFVSKASVGGEGLTLTRTRAEVFYNTTFNPSERIQAEDRAHRIGLKHPLLIVDLVARGTIDEYILENLRKKADTSAVVMGDNLRGRI